MDNDNRRLNVIASNSLSKFNKIVDFTKIKVRNAKATIDRYSESLGDLSENGSEAGNLINGLSGAAASLGSKIINSSNLELLKNIAKESINSATIQIDVEAKVAESMKKTRGVTVHQIDMIKSYARKLQETGVVGDEVTLSGVNQLSNYRLQADTIKQLMPGMQDLLVKQNGVNVSFENATNIGDLLGKAMTGQVKVLNDIGLSYSKNQEAVLKYGTEQEKARVLSDILSKNVGGLNKKMLECDDGKIKSISNSYNEMKELIGKKLLPIQSKFLSIIIRYVPQIKSIFSTVVEYVSGKITEIVNYISSIHISMPSILNLKDKILELLSSVMKIGEYLTTKLKPIFKWFVEVILPNALNALSSIISIGSSFLEFLGKLYEDSAVFKFIGDHLDIILVALGGFVTAIKVISVIQTAFIAFKTAAVAGCLAIKGAILFLTSPIGLIAAAIAALVAIGYMVWKNWDAIVIYLTNLWTNFSAFMSALWSAMIAKISAIGSNIKAIFSGIGQFITGAFQAAYNGTIAIFSGIGEFFKGIFGGIINFFKAGVNSWISIFNFVIDKINGVSFKVPDWVPKIGGNTVGFQIAPIPMLAKGGIATGPTLAMIGEGSESEAVLPLSKLSSLINLGKSESNSETINIQKEGSKKESIRIDYSPVFHITSESSKSEIERLLAMDKLELERLIKRILSNEKRLSMI